MNRLSVPTAVIFAVIFFILSGACRHESGSDFIDDNGNVLTVHEKGHIVLLCEKLLTDLDIHIKVVTLRESPPDINRRAVDIFADYKLGEKTRGARGILFLVDPEGKQVRLEIGCDLEPVFTDGFTGYIERGQMGPFFRSGRVGAGIEATIELLVGRAIAAAGIQDAGLKPDDSSEENHYSGGGGAVAGVEIGSGSPEKRAASSPEKYSAQPSPGMALRTYMEVLALHVNDPNLGLYTPETRAFFREWIVTDAQQDNSLRGLERVAGRGILSLQGDRAVIRFPVDDRNAPPYFFRKDSRGWMIDFITMNRAIRFNHKNQWFFHNTDHDFMFGFEGLIFDTNGFPHEKH